VPLGFSVTRKIRCVGERDVVLLDFLVLSREVTLSWIGVFEISFGDRWDLTGARRDEAGFYCELNERRWDDVLLALNLEKCLLDPEVRQLASDLLGLLETIIGKAGCLS
jgi:hypothetical protein